MIQVADGVWLLDGILGLPIHPLNVYLVDDVLIDGATRWHFWSIRRQLRGRKLGMVALTHCHPDHQGVVKRFCRELRLPLACHEADVPVMEGRSPMSPNNPIVRYLGGLIRGEPWKVDRVLRDGDMVAGFRVIHTPGHTPGHVVFFREQDGVAIAGDILSNMSFWGFRTGLYPPPPFFCTDPVQHRRSVEQLRDLRPKLVLFGHGPPLTKVEQFDSYVERMKRRYGG